MHPTVVAFDVDRTLTVRDCVVPFMRRVAGPVGFGAAMVGGGLARAGAVARRERDVLKAEFIRRVFAGRQVDEVAALGVDFAAEVSRSWMRTDVATRLRWHQDQDHVVLLVSASLDPYLEPLGDLLEVDAVLCTTLESVDGTYTGSLVGGNCRAEEKVARIASWCLEAGVPIDALEWAYGDSGGDVAMLTAASTGVLVGRHEISGAPG